jgi:hypothetical protein
MTTPHPVHALKAKLQAARLKTIETLASQDVAISSDALRELAAIQIALTAVRDEIEDHGVKLGWGDSGAALD